MIGKINTDIKIGTPTDTRKCSGNLFNVKFNSPHEAPVDCAIKRLRSTCIIFALRAECSCLHVISVGRSIIGSTLKSNYTSARMRGSCASLIISCLENPLKILVY